MQSFKSYIRNPKSFLISVVMNLNWLFSDETYLKILYFIHLGKSLNLKNPTTFTEKLQWLKLYNHRQEYTTMVDKYAVKEYVRNILGDEYIISTIGVWNKPEDIDFESLPNRFVLKTTNGGGGGGVVICKDKSQFNKEAALVQLKHSLAIDIYKTYKEWPYKNVPKRILAEEFIEDKNNSVIRDYKFYCFSGKVAYLMIADGRFSEEKTFDYFDRDFNHLPFTQSAKNSNLDIPKPKSFDEMVACAEKLSAGIPHVRVDLYNVGGKIYFGELTFFDASGFDSFEPEIWDSKIGALLQLPDKNCR